MAAMPWGRRAAAAAVVSVSLMSLGCSAQPRENSEALEWADCADWVDTETLPTAQCTTVAVPVNWNDAANPEAPQAQLAVIRIPASGDRMGVLFANPGGPGASAVEFVERFAAEFADSELGHRFDIVGFDPRGTGFSTPEFRCRTDAEIDEERRESMVDNSPAGVARVEQLNREYGQKCQDRMGADFLASMDTLSTARDMDAVRAALGEKQVNYLGFSYGTRLGTAYAELFADRVRAMVLDGVVDQNVDPIEETVGQAQGFQDAFDTYAVDCAKSPNCPLGTDPAQFVTRYHQLVDPLVTKPAHTADPRGLSYDDAIQATNEALYNPDDWQALTDGLTALANGTDAGDLLDLADRNMDRDENGHYGSDDDAFNAIHCVDQTYSTDPADYVEADRRWREAAPFESFGQFSGFAPRDVCVFWPVKPASEQHPPTSPGPGKVLVVSTTGDPATPYQVGVDVAAQLDAPVITYDGARHTVTLRGVECVDNAVEKFFIDLVLPPAGLRC